MMAATPLAPLAPLPVTRMMLGTANNMTMMSSASATTTAMASLSMQPRSRSPPPSQMQSHSQSQSQPQQQTPTMTVAALEWQYFQAVSLFRRRKYEKCIEVCNGMLRAGHETNVQMFSTQTENHDADAQYVGRVGGGGAGGGGAAAGNGIHNRVHNMQSNASSRQGRGYSQNFKNNNNNNNNNNNSSINVNGNNNKVSMPTWMMEGVWQLKMRALTQRVYIDDLETDDAFEGENEEVELERIATAARPGTSIKTAFIPRPSTSTLRASSTAASRSGLPLSEGSRTATARSRPKSGVVRPGTTTLRPGSSVGSRPASRCGTASRIRATSAAAYTVGDVTAKLYQASRLNPTIYAEREALIKALFQFLYYHESDVPKAYSLCEAVMEVHKQKRTSGSSRSGAPVDWWWDQQMGRCLLIMRMLRKAEMYLVQSLAVFPHPDTFLLLSRLYQRLHEPERALELIGMAVDQHPFNVTFRIEQARIFDAMSKPDDAIQIYRLITKLDPISVEALASIAMNHFYDGNPEMALMYYRRILSLGIHSAELYCNIALCCLYGGQIDLVLPCFQRALHLSKTADQKEDIWYNLSFVALSTGDFHLTRRCLQLCLTADASNGAALNNLAVLAAHTGDLMRAKSYLQAAKEVLVNSTEIDSNLEYMQAHYKL